LFRGGKRGGKAAAVAPAPESGGGNQARQTPLSADYLATELGLLDEDAASLLNNLKTAEIKTVESLRNAARDIAYSAGRRYVPSGSLADIQPSLSQVFLESVYQWGAGLSVLRASLCSSTGRLTIRAW